MAHCEFALRPFFWCRQQFGCEQLEMMQNGVRTSKFGGRSDQLCVWCMQFIFVEFLDKNDVFGQNAFANEEVVTANAFGMVFGYGRSQDEHQCGL